MHWEQKGLDDSSRPLCRAIRKKFFKLACAITAANPTFDCHNLICALKLRATQLEVGDRLKAQVLIQRYLKYCTDLKVVNIHVYSLYCISHLNFISFLLLFYVRLTDCNCFILPWSLTGAIIII